MIFGELSDIVENDILTMQRFLEVFRFLYSGGWQVCKCLISDEKLIYFISDENLVVFYPVFYKLSRFIHLTQMVVIYWLLMA